jgi:hypothetical protein
MGLRQSAISIRLGLQKIFAAVADLTQKEVSDAAGRGVCKGMVKVSAAEFIQ